LDDKSVKFVRIDYANGLRVLMAYTGIARLPDQTPVGEWLRTTLRGNADTPDDSMTLLRQRLDRDIAPLGYGLIVNLLGIRGDERYFGVFTNIRLDRTIRPDFDYGMYALPEPCVIGNGSGAKQVVRGGHYNRLVQQLDVRPRKVFNHMKLLATVNRRVAKVDSSVSPHCHVSFINADNRFEPQSYQFAEGDESAPFGVQPIFMGVDLNAIVQPFIEAMTSGVDPSTVECDVEEMNRQLRRRE
jgi:hypothetical protein